MRLPEGLDGLSTGWWGVREEVYIKSRSHFGVTIYTILGF